MTDSARRLGALVAWCAVVWHALTVLTPAWVLSADQRQARDFASYYYAVEVAHRGGDPYATRQLNDAARAEGMRAGVHPFLYAPPFLLGMAWVLGFDLPGAYHLWFWLHEALAVASAIALWRWWRPLSPAAGPVVALVFAAMTAIPNNHLMGQANFPGLLLSILGLWQTERGRPVVGGALMGAACMLKMSPALFVVWWLVRREWAAVASAVGAAALLSVAALPFAGPAVQWRFYTQVLPTFSSGGYNGLAVSISIFGNHSVPNLLEQAFPGTPAGLSPLARALSSLFAVASLGALCVAFLRDTPRSDALRRAAQASAFGVLLLLIPVYTYEHHLVFALPAAVLAVLAVDRGELGRGWLVPVAFSVAILLFDLKILKAQAGASPLVLAGILQEAKFGSLIGLLAVTTWLGARRPAGPA